MQIQTPSSILRPWKDIDRNSLVTNANNPDIAVNMRDGFPYPYTHADAEKFITLANGDSRNLFLAIEVDSVAVGGIGIHLLDDVYHRTAEIGYWLGESYWGRGIVSDAVKAILPLAFARYDIIRIQAGVFSNNFGSMRVLEKNGFILEAILKKAITKHEETLNEHIYVVFRD